MNNLVTFINTYKNNLHIAVRDYPQEYSYPLTEVDTVASRMAVAFSKGSYNKDSRAIKATCKQLNIKHTYKAIAEYLKG